jgi:hypothetical protein
MPAFLRSPLLVGLAAIALGAAGPAPLTATVTIEAGLGPVAKFAPSVAFGAGLDGGSQGDADRLYTPHNVAAMRSAGLKRVTYRLRTELGVEAWHWNPEGRWSDPARAQGYWTSSDRPGKPIMTSWGYNLPRRGDTIDQANNEGWSRLDDGDLTTFWKTNPYLAPRFSHDVARPQWAIVELGDKVPIDTARIWWGDPYAQAFEVQYWTGVDEYDAEGRWVAFPGGVVTDAKGGEADLKLAPAPVRTAFVRLLMKQSSGGAGPGDIRDHLGFAVREVALGLTGADGQFHDALHRAPSHAGQSIVHVSSTDPWHRAIDRDPQLEQPGLDRVFRSGLTNGLPMMVPVGVLYDTPENTVAEVRYLRRRGYPLTQVELGEEPDGQYLDAADYGALYLETVDALRPVSAGLVLGGPSLQSGFSDTWLDPDPDRSWTHHLIRYLKARGRLADLGFFSFERYPFDDMCGDIGRKLRQQTGMMSDLFARLDREEVPRNIPWIITEYGFSAYSGHPMVELPSALLDADLVGQFLTGGGDAAYMFGYGPNWPVNQHLVCAGYGNMMLQQADADGQAGARMPAYWFARMLTDDWTQAGMGEHRLYAVKIQASEPPAPGDGPAITAYAVRKPQGEWAVMVSNRDGKRAAEISLNLDGQPLRGPVEVVQYSMANYEWKDDGENGHPIRNLPPFRTQRGDAKGAFSLPPYSLTVIKGAASPAARLQPFPASR